MKHLVKLVVVTFFLIASTNVFAEQKIAFMDMKLLLNESKAGKGAQDYLQKIFKEGQKKFLDLENELKKDEKKLLSQKNVLSKEDYKKNSDSLREKVNKYQKERRETLEKITKKRATAKEKMIKILNPLVEKYINENGISLIVDKKIVLAGSNEIDITNNILEILNKELPTLKLN